MKRSSLSLPPRVHRWNRILYFCETSHAICTALRFGTLIEQERLFCLYTAAANNEADPGFRAADTPSVSDTRIPRALSTKSQEFVVEAENQLATLLLSVRSSRGHDMAGLG